MVEDSLNYILMPGRNRPEFFDITLESLMENQGIENYKILFTFEYDVSPEYYDVVRRYTKYPSQIEIKRWDTSHGLTRGHLEGMKLAFEKTDEYVIVVEDDISTSKDFLKCLDYCYRKFSGGNGVVSGGAYSSGTDVKKVRKTHWYSPYGVLLPKSFFVRFLLPHCTEAYYKDPTYVDRYYPEWEHRGKYFEQAGLINRILHKENLWHYQPEVPRCQDIGWFGKNRTNRFAEYRPLTLQQKINLNRQIWSDISLIKKFGYKEPFYVLKDDHDWTDLELVE